jgi:hypothetical protein
VVNKSLILVYMSRLLADMVPSIGSYPRGLGVPDGMRVFAGLFERPECAEDCKELVRFLSRVLPDDHEFWTNDLAFVERPDAGPGLIELRVPGRKRKIAEEVSA